MKSTQPQQVAGGTKTIGGIAANSLMRPIIIVLALLHVAIIGLIMQINATSAELSETMKTAGQQIEEATSVLAGASLLSETSTNFILMPVTEHGEINVAPLKIDKKKPLILNEETIAHYDICQSCHPIPGDDVLGYFDGISTITIHKRQCELAAKLKASDGNHILAAKWDTHKQISFPATLHIEGIDHIGVLHQITGILYQQLNVNIHKLDIDSQDGIFKAEIRLGVHDVNDIRSICKNLKKIKEIKDVKRF